MDLPSHGRTVEFWSSVEYGTFLRGLVRELRTAGWEAEQHFVVSECEYRGASGRRARVALRARSYVQYPLRLHRRLLIGKRPSVLVVCSNTFYAPAVALSASAWRKVPVVHWMFDLFPDVLIHAGRLRRGSMVDRLLSRMTRFSLRSSAANVFIGGRLRTHAENLHGPLSPSVVIPVGADAHVFRKSPPVERASDRPLELLYCGNLGRMHDGETVAGLICHGVPDGWKFGFRVNGAGARSLNDVLLGLESSERISVEGYLEERDWAPRMSRADVALVTVRSGAETVMLPSKVYSAMAAGQAVLAICPPESDLADLVREHDAGWVIEPGNVEALRRLLVHLDAHRGEVLECRKNAFAAAHQHFGQKTLVHRWVSLLESVCSVPATTHERPSMGCHLPLSDR